MNDSLNQRNPWVAAVLSLVSTGLGHIYSGHIVRGLALFCGSLLFAPCIVALAFLQASTEVLILIIAVVIAAVVLIVFGVNDAWRVARKSSGKFVLRDYNSPWVYFFLGLVGLIYPARAVASLRTYVFEAFYVPSTSMSPTILEGDRILTNKVRRESTPPERGDVVVFRVSDKAGQYWVRRVIALPGDRIAVLGGEVFVNGKKLDRDRVPDSHLGTQGQQIRGQVFKENNSGSSYLVEIGGGEEHAADFAEKIVPEGQYFLLGDNRDRSHDSRVMGFVPRGEIIGKATYIYLPAKSWSRFGKLGL